MSDLMPIVEGCRAVIINSRMGHNGVEVTVGKYLGVLKDRLFPDQWGISVCLKDSWGMDCCEAAESQLMRIDGNEDQFKEENVRLELEK